MGVPGAPGGSVKPLAQAHARERASQGELVHITNARGVRVKRGGSFVWERVPAGGMTVHSQGTQIKTADGGRATITSVSRGAQDVGGGQLLEVDQLGAAPRGAGDVKLKLPPTLRARMRRRP